MSSANDPGRECERIVRRFEQAWRQGERPEVEAFLPAEEPLRRAVLVELVHTDLELRLATGEDVRVEAYLARFPELATPPEVVMDLVGVEIAHRQRQGAVSLEEYQKRFPLLQNQLTLQLGPVPTLPSGGTTGGMPSSPPGYEILGELGRGGMGVVYKARHVALDRVVAVKMILSGEYAGAEERRRFRNEAQVIARLQHPNVVQVHEVGEHDGRPFLVLEYVAGGSLAERLRQGRLAAREAAQLVEQLARGIQTAHEAGIVHRDLKPGNVLLSRRASWQLARLPEPAASLLYDPKITDFGLAKRLEAGERLTQSGAIVGTPAYLAPEQASGSKEIGPGADVYALGAILYECLTGQAPFEAATPFDTIARVLTEDPVPPRQHVPTVPRDLDTITLKCLRKDPMQRYTSARALADDLHRHLVGEPILARRVGHLERLRRWCRRRPLVTALTALLVVAILTGGGGTAYLLRANHQRDLARARAALARGDTLAKEQELKGALAAYTEAVELDPTFVKAYLRRAAVLCGLQRDAEAIRDCDTALQLDHTQADAYVLRSTAHFAIAQYEKVIRDCDEALAREDRLSGDYTVHIVRSIAYAMLGQWDRASEDYAVGAPRKVGGVQLESSVLAMTALCLLAKGNLTEYRTACNEMLTRYADGTNLEAQYLTARVCAQSANSGVDPRRTVQLAQNAVRVTAAWRLHALALAHYRAGQLDDAAQRLAESNSPGWAGQPSNNLVLAMIHHRRGNVGEAKRLLAEACAKPFPVIHPHESVAFQLLRREAEGLINASAR